jgi:hypothetical protein
LRRTGLWTCRLHRTDTLRSDGGHVHGTGDTAV